MNRRRQSLRTLTGTRIYVRNGKFTYYSSEKILNGRSGKLTNWHVLCAKADGELKARTLLEKLLSRVPQAEGPGNFSPIITKWLQETLKEREVKVPKDPHRLKMFKQGTAVIESLVRIISHAFCEFDLSEITQKDVRNFLKQWKGRRAAKSYLSKLSMFFDWCVEEEYMTANIALGIKLKAPPKT